MFKKFGIFLIFSILVFCSASFIGLNIKVSSGLKDVCCIYSGTENFKEFAADPSFLIEHEEPLLYESKPIKGKNVTFKTADNGLDGRGFLLKSKGKSDKYIFVIHEWWGLNEYVKKEAYSLYSAMDGKVNVLAIDMYDGKVTDKREEAAQLMQSVTSERGQAIILGAASFAGTSSKITTIGWCFGGGWSLNSAILLGKQAKGCVMYYGMPVKEKEALEKLETSVLGIFATQDTWINSEVVSAFEKNMKEANKEVTIYSYDATHAFANPSNPGYKPEDTKDAFEKVIRYLKESFNL